MCKGEYTRLKRHFSLVMFSRWKVSNIVNSRSRHKCLLPLKSMQNADYLLLIPRVSKKLILKAKFNLQPGMFLYFSKCGVCQNCFLMCAKDTH